MATKVKLFPTEAKDEKILFIIRRARFIYAIFVLINLLAAVGIAAIIFFWILDPTLFSSLFGDFVITGSGTFIMAVLAVQLYGFVDYYLDIYIVTNLRIIDVRQDGFFRRQISELHLHQIQDVNASVNNFWGTFFHFGDVEIQTAGERENFIFRSIPHPYRVAQEIANLHHAQLERDTSQGACSSISPILNEQIDKNDTGLPYLGLETQAKELLANLEESKESDYSIVDKSLLVQQDHIEEKPKNKKTTKKNRKTADLSETEGLLEEGKEIDLEK
jgi:hypothetical protein